jgi:protein O-mannosyl-transferase
MFDLASSLRSPWPWLALFVLFSTLWIRKSERRLAFLVAWWPVALLPVLDIRQLSFPQLADRFAYIPSVGLCLAIAYLVLDWLPRRAPQLQPARFAVPALAVVLIFYAAGTVRAIPRWRDNNTLYGYSLRVSPNTPLLHVRHALVLEYEKGKLDEAASEYRAAMRLDNQTFWPIPLARDCYLGLGRIALREGHREQAIAFFKKALDIDPNSSDAFDALGSLYFPSGDYATAASYFEKAVAKNPQDLGGRFYLGTCDMKLGKFREASAQFHAARVVDPSYRQAFVAEAKALEAAGDSTAAARVFSEIPK